MLMYVASSYGTPPSNEMPSLFLAGIPAQQNSTVIIRAKVPRAGRSIPEAR